MSEQRQQPVLGEGHGAQQREQQHLAHAVGGPALQEAAQVGGVGGHPVEHVPGRLGGDEAQRHRLHAGVDRLPQVVHQPGAEPRHAAVAQHQDAGAQHVAARHRRQQQRHRTRPDGARHQPVVDQHAGELRQQQGEQVGGDEQQQGQQHGPAVGPEECQQPPQDAARVARRLRHPVAGEAAALPGAQAVGRHGIPLRARHPGAAVEGRRQPQVGAGVAAAEVGEGAAAGLVRGHQEHARAGHHLGGEAVAGSAYVMQQDASTGRGEHAPLGDHQVAVPITGARIEVRRDAVQRRLSGSGRRHRGRDRRREPQNIASTRRRMRGGSSARGASR